MARRKLRQWFRPVAVVTIVLLAGSVLRAQSEAFEETFRKGAEALRAGRPDEAAASFEECTQLMPRFAEAWLNLGLARLQQQRFDDASAALSKAVELKPRLRGANLFLGISRYRLNDAAGATAALRRETEIDPASSPAFMWLGVVELSDGRAAEAAAHLDKAAQLNPRDIDILYHQGRAHMMLSRDIYEHMFNLDPNSWRVHQVLAESFSEADRLDDAVKEATEAVRLKPDAPGLHQQLADIYWKRNNLDLAEAEFANELKIDPRNVTCMYKLAVVSIERSKPAPAAKLLSEVLRYNPHSINAHYQLGRALAQMGQNEAAVPHFAAVVAEPDKAEGDIVKQSYYQLSQLYRRLHQPEQSRAALDAFLHLKQQADAQQQEKLQDKLKRAQSGGSAAGNAETEATAGPDSKP